MVMHRKKKSKRGIIDEDLPVVSESNARKQVIFGLIAFVGSGACVWFLAPGVGQLLETLIIIGVVASSTVGGMRFGDWVDKRERAEHSDD